DYGYAVFGKVVDGMDVVDAIAVVQTGPGDVPNEQVIIESLTVVE
ncbi:MAG: peptidylprolyl isomerase, partial [Deltaproteobacteria bacterium]|nr:peptidylprolyl isomerase [Deltaproteobacteria bacterium]